MLLDEHGLPRGYKADYQAAEAICLGVRTQDPGVNEGGRSYVVGPRLSIFGLVDCAAGFEPTVRANAPRGISNGGD